MTYGRPMKGATRRIPITIHTTTGMIDTIDAYVDEQRREGHRAYSRSDFFNEAVTLYLHQLALTPESDNAAIERSKSVPDDVDSKNAVN
ncbi:hypothetical protein SDC9_159680 [bioreactor metagenome]|uniref:Uncharacterized protein n=1 Tax=bioreactor metagenome TaxID=1076179 RepID=A0A645FFU4_9ZZZZ|nr:hypothetical protein [Oscillospiraceae bacterium]